MNMDEIEVVQPVSNEPEKEEIMEIPPIFPSELTEEAYENEIALLNQESARIAEEHAAVIQDFSRLVHDFNALSVSFGRWVNDATMEDGYGKR